MIYVVYFIAALGCIAQGAGAIECYECAFLEADTGNSLVDGVIAGIFNWDDDDCLDKPEDYGKRTCGDPAQTCVTIAVETELEAEALGTPISGTARVVYRNCSELASPELECGEADEDMLDDATEEILGQVEYLVDLDEVEFNIKELEGAVCFCDTDSCNDQVEFEEEEGSDSVESSTTHYPSTSPFPEASCYLCATIEAGKKVKKQLKNYLPAKADNKCLNSPDDVKNGMESCSSGICASIHLNISAYEHGGKTKRAEVSALVRGCIPDLLGTEGEQCYGMDDILSLPSGDIYVSALEQLLSTELEVTAMAACVCDEDNCNDVSYSELVSHGKIDNGESGCIDSCDGMDDGMYHACVEPACGKFFVCNKNSKKKKNRELLKSCGKKKHWDSNLEKCVKKGKSETCEP